MQGPSLHWNLAVPNVPWIKEILSGSRNASWLPSLTAMEKNWHRRHTTGGCNPLVRLEKVGSSLETQFTLILAIALLTMVWEHLSPGSSLCSPRDLWEPQLSGARYFSRNKCKDGNLCFRVPGTSGFRLRWYNPFPIHKRPPSSFSFTENLATSVLSTPSYFLTTQEYFSGHTDDLSNTYTSCLRTLFSTSLLLLWATDLDYSVSSANILFPRPHSPPICCT